MKLIGFGKKELVVGVKLIIAGGRDFVYQPIHVRKLNSLRELIAIVEVVSGCAKGADKFGELWANGHGIPVKRFKADWDKYGKAAGAIRNEEMAKYASDVVLFPGNRGTNNMYEQAEKYGLKIWDWRKDNA